MLRKTQVHSVFAVLLFFYISQLRTLNAESSTDSVEDQPEINSGTRDVFLYFACGSNMLGKRLHMLTPTAAEIGVAELKNYRLDFDQLNQKWRGARATIRPAENETVYGVLWAIDQRDLENLERREGVLANIYASLNVSVNLLFNNTEITARTYVPAAGERDNSKFDRRPSKTYLKCIVKGAQEHELPTAYIHYLQSIEHNTRIAPKFDEILELQNFQIMDSN